MLCFSSIASPSSGSIDTSAEAIDFLNQIKRIILRATGYLLLLHLQ